MRKSSTGLREISSRVLIFPYKFCMSVSGMILAEHRIQKWEHRWKRRQPVCAQVGQEERLQLQVTGSSWGISDGRAGHWWQREQSVVTSTRDIRTLQPAVTFTLSSRLLTHWPHCQARWRSKGQQWSGVEQTFKPLVTLQSLATDGDKYEARTEPAPDVTHCTRDSGLRSGSRPSGIDNMAFLTSVR